MDYQTEQLAKHGYTRVLETDFLDFERQVGEILSRITVDWHENPDKVMYSAIVRVIHNGNDVATWFSEKTFKFHLVLREAEEVIKFASDILKGER